MLRLPDSPRARRRLAWTSAAGVLVAVGLAVAILVPSRREQDAAPTVDEGPAQVVTVARARLTAADRRQIDRLLDRFIPAGVARKDPAAAWALAGPEMRNGSSLANWRKGTTPIPFYPAKEPNFHHWKTIEVEERSAILNLLVHPVDPKKLGSWVFSIQVVKQRGTWLVNRIYTIAVMNPATRPATVTHELGPADYAAPPASNTSKSAGGGSHFGLLPVLAILGLVLLIPLTLGGVALVRARRWRAAVRESGRTELPPLPGTYRGEREEKEKVTSHS
jgi:hypothetical protein